MYSFYKDLRKMSFISKRLEYVNDFLVNQKDLTVNIMTIKLSGFIKKLKSVRVLKVLRTCNFRLSKLVFLYNRQSLSVPQGP